MRTPTYTPTSKPLLSPSPQTPQRNATRLRVLLLHSKKRTACDIRRPYATTPTTLAFPPKPSTLLTTALHYCCTHGRACDHQPTCACSAPLVSQLGPFGPILAPAGSSHSEATQRTCSSPQTHWLRHPNPAPQETQPTCPHLVPVTDTGIWSNTLAYAIPSSALVEPSQRRTQSLLQHQASESSFQSPARTGATPAAPCFHRSGKRIGCAV